ncbi:MAG: RNA polymerase sigma factor [Bacteroidales bacterium]|nr:RNA polymerase sigma factor [Bacteroidales bacterium]
MNEVQFRQQVLPLKNKLYRLALRITLDSAEAEDVVQDVFIRIWQRAQQTDETDALHSIEAFAHTVCRNLALDRAARKSAENLSLDEQTYDAVSHEATPIEQLEYKELVQHAQRLLDELPERQRTIMLLREVEEKSYREIATLLDVSEETVKVTLHRARQTLRQQLADLRH